MEIGGKHPSPDPSKALTQPEFIKVMRTGDDVHCDNDPSDPICNLGPPTPVLQVMPWPSFHSMTDSDLEAIYQHLSAVPSADPCNTVADGCPVGAAPYVYANMNDCPNPAPPQWDDSIGPGAALSDSVRVA
jgi:hypothetical protein